MMNRIMLGALISTAIVGTTFAEGPSPAFNGVYLGGGLTYTNGKIDNKAGGSSIRRSSSRGVGFNGFLGYGMLLGSGFYLGGELGLGYDGSRFNKQKAGTAIVNGVSTALRYHAKSSITYNAAARLGYAFWSFLPYVKVGFEGRSAPKLETPLGDQIMFGGKQVRIRRNGVILGGGVDYALTKNVFVRGEYTHNFGTRSSYTSNGTKIADLRTSTDTFLIGAAYRY